MALLFYSTVDRADVWHRELRRLSPDLDIRSTESAGSPGDITHALVWNPPRGLLASFPNLRGIFSLGAGVDHLLADADFPRHVPLVRVVDHNLTMRMTAHVVLHVLLHHRRLPGYMDQQRRGVWEELDQPVPSDVRVGVMGLGVLGTAAAGALKSLTFDVAGWSRTEKSGDIVSYAGESGFEPFLSRTDILVCLLPLTDQTRGILNMKTFSSLARGAAEMGPVLINAGRGGHQVEGDIVQALNQGVLQAASLDVFSEEPLPPESPLWRHDRVIMTPHIASITDSRAVARQVVEGMARLDRGDMPDHLVDWSRGY